MRVATHDGNFHADDVFAIAVLKLVYKNKLEVVRTRDPKIYNACDLRVDVGGDYNPGKGNYDHHQPGGAPARLNGIPYAAFGLIWDQFGPQICPGYVIMIDRSLVQAIDAADNGIAVPVTDEENSGSPPPYLLMRLINKMRPCWDEDLDSDKAFKNAVKLAVIVLKREIANFSAAIRASELVRKAVANAKDKRIIFLDRWCPYEYVLRREAPESLLVVFHNETDGQ